MLKEFDKGMMYLAVLTGMLMVLAYWAGAKQLGITAGDVGQKLGYTFSGRNSQGNFPAYPTNAPA